MRRALVLLLGLLCLGSVSLVVAPSAQALATPRGVKASAGGAFEAITVSWTWSSKPASYVVQVAKSKSFEGAEESKVAAKGARPPGGRQSYRFAGLENGTKYFVRVAAVAKNGSRSGWSGVADTVTRTRVPSGGQVSATEGPGPGEVTFTWKTDGDYTDHFEIQTATTSFNQQSPRDLTVFKVDADRRKYTLSAEETEQANAGIGTAWTLVWRFYSVNRATPRAEKNYYGQDQVRVPGMPPAGSGSKIRVASYNIRTDKDEQGSISWNNRVPRIVDQIKQVGRGAEYRPGIVLLQELYAPMVDKFVDTLADRGMGHYALNRETALFSGLEDEKKLQNRILYDTEQYEIASPCSTSSVSIDCHLVWPSDTGPDFSPILKMRDRYTGEEFYVVSLHLPNGEGLDDVRRQAMASILDQLEVYKAEGLPIIIGGDHNSSQLREGVRPHDLYMDRGYYDTASTVTHVKPEYGTANDFEYQEPSPFGISPRIDLIATWGMPGSAKFVNEVIAKGDPFPSDHNMIWADLRLP